MFFWSCFEYVGNSHKIQATIMILKIHPIFNGPSLHSNYREQKFSLLGIFNAFWALRNKSHTSLRKGIHNTPDPSGV